MYVFFDSFTKALKEKGLEDSNYQLDVSIDGNIAKWILYTPEKRISNIFKSIMQDYVFNDKEIKIAISKIEQKNGFISKIKDVDLLRREVSSVSFTKKKLEITDDSMQSPAIDFYNLA
jgi:hypothetical protein